MNENVKQKSSKDLAYIGLFSAIIVICSFITIPTTIPFTLQTFAVMLTLGLLGGKRGTLAVVVYVLLGIIGLPVFSGFRSGIGVLLGTTGGYIIGFIFSALTMWLIERLFGYKKWLLPISMFIGEVVLYIFGTAWFMVVYANNTGAIGLSYVLSVCVVPFIIPDIIKLCLASYISIKLRDKIN